MATVVTRFAPSPTGFMHIGGVRTALFAWLYARKNNGSFILRIEDTDKEREVPGSIEHIIESLEWLGIAWDEGVKVEGPHGPYIQSQRLSLYQAYAQKLIDAGHAYPDPYTEEELEALRKADESENRLFLFRNHRPSSPGVWDGTKALRFKVPIVKRYTWNDLVRGELSAGEEALDDFVLIKSDGYPTYNFAHVVDDIEMKVTHVMRAEEFIPSIPKFLSLYEALEVAPPQMAILPVILGPDGKKKLSKRDGAKDILDYRTEGYLPDAIVNFLALIGWNPGTEQEIFTREELIKAFSIEQIQTHGGAFNEEKLRWMNKEHLRHDSDETVDAEIRKRTGEHPKIVAALTTAAGRADLRERLSVYSDISTMLAEGEFDFYERAPVIEASSLLWKKDPSPESAMRHLTEVHTRWGSIPHEEFMADTVKEVVWDYAEKEGRGNVLWPLRYALSGRERSPDPFTLAEALGKDETMSRIETAVTVLTNTTKSTN